MYLTTINSDVYLLFSESEKQLLCILKQVLKKKKKSCYISKNHKLSEEIENGLKFCPKMSELGFNLISV